MKKLFGIFKKQKPKLPDRPLTTLGREKTKEKKEATFSPPSLFKQSESIQVEKPDTKTTPSVLRAEFNLTRFPIFDVSHKTSKRKTLEIREKAQTSEGEIDILWKVTRGLDRGYPGALARRIHVEAVEMAINELQKPIPRLIYLGSLRDICRRLNIAICGKNTGDIKKVLIDTKMATIETRKTFRAKESNGAKKFHEGYLNLYDMVFFTGEMLPDGSEADGVYILLNDLYVQNINNGYVIPLDLPYLQSLKGDVTSRLYEVLSVWFFPALERNMDYIEKPYSTLCSYTPLTRQKTKAEARKKLKRAHDQHVLSGFLSGVEWLPIPDRPDDWTIKYMIGPRAKEWYGNIKRTWGTRKTLLQDVQGGDLPSIISQSGPREEVPSRSGQRETDQTEKKPAKNPLIDELTDLGVSAKTALHLVNEYDHQIIRGQVDSLPYRKNIEDKAAFLVQSIRENFPLPKEFTKKRARETEAAEDELRAKYNRYILEMVNEHLQSLSPDQIKKELDEYWPVFFDKLPPHFKTDLSEGYLRKQCEYNFKMDKAKSLGLPSFEEWKSKRD